MRRSRSKRDHPTIVDRRIQQLTGTAKEAVHRAHADVAGYSKPGGVESCLGWLSTAVGIGSGDEKILHVGHSFHTIERIRGTETMREWHRKTQCPCYDCSRLSEVHLRDTSVATPTVKMNTLPTEALRGSVDSGFPAGSVCGFYLTRSGLATKDCALVRQYTKVTFEPRQTRRALTTLSGRQALKE